jgi:UDP-N-acetylmuramoyl-tripeptide--D-alanyl-D-alanine ligase
MIVDLVLLFVLFLAFFSWLKLNLFLLYIWQNYEYRIDRVIAYLRSARFRYDFLDFINPFEFFIIRRPKVTLKILFLLVVNCYTQGVIFLNYLKPTAVLLNITHFFLLAICVTLILVIMLQPLISLFLVVLVNIPSTFIKEWVVLKARNKMKSYPNLLTIGITGSYGKTSTKLILDWILKTKYKVVSTSGSVNTSIGVARTILKKITPEVEIFIVEMGAYKTGEIKKICNLVHPRIGIVTGINTQHMELFGSQEKILRAKYELLDSLPKHGLAIINIGNPLSRRLFGKVKIKKIGYKKPTKKIPTNLEAGFLQENIQAAIKVARYLKVDHKKINKALKKIPLNKYILQIKKGINQSHVIDNSYNTNPQSFVESLRILKKKSKQKAVVVTPGIIELGASGQEVHRYLAQEMSGTVHTLILTNPNFFRLFCKELTSDVALILAKPKTDLRAIIKRNSWVLLEGRIPTWLYNKIIKN